MVPATPGVRELDIDWRSTAMFLAAFSALVAFTGLVRSVPRTATALAVGTILALGLDPPVGWVCRRTKASRGTAVGAVLVGFVVGLTAIAVLLVPPAVDQGRQLSRDLPEVVGEITRLPLVGERLERSGVPQRVEQFLQELPDRLTGEDTPLPTLARTAAGGVFLLAVTLLFAITLLLDGSRLVGHARRAVPTHLQARADRLAELTYRVVGRYVAGSVLVAVVAGVATLIAGLALGVPLAPLCAVWVTMWNVVPQIGGAVGGLPFVLLGLTQGAGTGAACAVFFVIYLQLENNVVAPLLVGQAVRLSPPATMTAALIGVSAGGVVGALLAVPLLGAAKVAYLELRPARGQPARAAERSYPGEQTAGGAS